MNLLRIKSGKSTSCDNKQFQFYWYLGLIFHKKLKFGFEAGWYDGAYYILDLGFLSFGLVESWEQEKT
jgi:hypothetical protein